MSYTHESQYQAGASTVTRRSGCTWTSAATGVDYATGGILDPEPDAVHALVKSSEEVNPATPGWAMGDVVLAMHRLGVPFADRSGQGWAAVRRAHNAGLFVVLQGDSDRFPDGCSGTFDGDHAIGIPGAGYDASSGAWRIDDPICSSSTYETEATLRAYAEKLAPAVRFGVFTGGGDMVRITKQGPWLIDFPVGTQIYDLAGHPVRKALGNGIDRLSPCETVIAGTAYNVCQIVNDKINQLMMVRAADVTDRTPMAAPKAYDVTVGGKSAGRVTLP